MRIKCSLANHPSFEVKLKPFVICCTLLSMHARAISAHGEAQPTTTIGARAAVANLRSHKVQLICLATEIQEVLVAIAK